MPVVNFAWKCLENIEDELILKSLKCVLMNLWDVENNETQNYVTMGGSIILFGWERKRINNNQ